MNNKKKDDKFKLEDKIIFGLLITATAFALLYIPILKQVAISNGTVYERFCVVEDKYIKGNFRGREYCIEVSGENIHEKLPVIKTNYFRFQKVQDGDIVKCRLYYHLGECFYTEYMN